jgi:CRP/FNR family cyclic AMP-dependent transcriptional regulator
VGDPEHRLDGAAGLLRLHPFVSSLTERDAQRVIVRMRMRRVPDGRVIFYRDEPGDGLHGIVCGRVAFAVDSPDGKELTLNVLGPGEFFGEIALLDGKGRSATAMARDACELLFIARRIHGLLARTAGGADPCRRTPCERLRLATDYIADAIFLGLSLRLAKHVLYLSKREGVPAETALRVSHAELASLSAYGASR